LTVLTYTTGMPTDPQTGCSDHETTVRTGFGFFFAAA
jgi:hypothetical protein